MDAARDPARSRWACLYLVLAVSFVLYAPSIGNDFTWDDRWAAMGSGETANPYVTEIRSPAAYLFDSHYWPARSASSHTYRPVTTASFALRYAVCGDNARVAHAINVLLHVLAVGLGYALLRRLGAGWRASIAASLVFGVHALHSEAVANIVGRAELLGFCAGAAATLVLQWSSRRAAARRWGASALAGALFTLAFASKESALAWLAFAPLCMIVARWQSGERAPFQRFEVARLAVTLVVPALLFLAARATMLSSLPVATDAAVGYLENPVHGAVWWARAATGLVAWGYGALLTILPFHLAVDYGPNQLPVVEAITDGWLMLAGAVALGFTVVVGFGVRNARRQPLAFMAVACFFGFSIVVSNVLFPVFMLFAERTYYTPSFGLALAVAWIAGRLPRSGVLRDIATVALGVWLGASAIVTWKRNHVWRDDDTLILTEVASSPRSVRLQLCAGVVTRRAGDLAAAADHFARAARLDPSNGDAWFELARVQADRAMWPQAVQALEFAGRARPADVVRLSSGLDELRARVAAATPR